jgi:hypothetical protein
MGEILLNNGKDPDPARYILDPDAARFSHLQLLLDKKEASVVLIYIVFF